MYCSYYDEMGTSCTFSTLFIYIILLFAAKKT
jgi:hypothetical protein